MPKKVSLIVKCPHCGRSFMDEENLQQGKPSIKLNIECNNNRGTIRLCSIYGCYDHFCDFDLKEGAIAKFFCPHCNKELISKDTCESCDAPMVPLILQVGGKVLICSRSGCNKHFVAFENLATEVRKFYHEYGF